MLGNRELACLVARTHQPFIKRHIHKLVFLNWKLLVLNWKLLVRRIQPGNGLPYLPAAKGGREQRSGLKLEAYEEVKNP